MILAPFQLCAIETRPMPPARVRNDHQAADPWRDLAAAVVNLALRDLSAGDAKTASKAREWLLSDGIIWAEGLGIDPSTFAVRVCSLAIEGERLRAALAEKLGDSI